jgi:PAS domain S-box-containing protein
MAFKLNNKKDISALSSQLRKSYLVLCVIILIFFLLYTLQSLFIYTRSKNIQAAVLADHKELRQIQTIKANISQLEYYAKDYLFTGDTVVTNKYWQLRNDLEKEVGTLSLLIGKDDVDAAYIDDLVNWIGKKLAITDYWINDNRLNAETELYGLSAINDSLYALLNSVQKRESDEIVARTESNNTYSRLRILFSTASYIIISIFLIVTLYKINQNIRRRLVAEERARINERKYKTLIEDSGLKILVINNKGFIKFASKNVEDLINYKPDEIIGMPLEKGIPRQFKHVAADIINVLNDTGKYNHTVELQLTTKENVDKWVLCKVFPVASENENTQEWQIVIWDIDEEKKIHLELEALEVERKKQQKLIQDIIDNIPSVVYIKDLEGKYILINKRMEEMLGKPANDIIGATDAKLIKERSRYDAYRSADDKVLSEKTFVTIDDEVNIAGKKSYHSVTKFPLFDDKGNVANTCGLINDITERKEAEIKLLNAKREADTARSAQETFLANMSHEIRTPMNGIIGMTNLILHTEITGEQKDFIENIQESSRNLMAIINDLLDFSKIRSGKFQFEYTDFNVRHTVSKALYPLSLKADEKLLKLNTQFADNIPEALIGDPVRLQQIIINLAGNAVKFTSNGKVDVDVTSQNLGANRIELTISVADTGIGIAESKLNYIFESFTQNNAQTFRKYGGTGLGLAIVKQLVELQSGNIQVSSVLGKGSVFIVTIPFEIGNAERISDKQTNKTQDNHLLNGLRILVAEDNLINQKVVHTTLVKQAAEVTLVSNGHDAIEIMKDEDFDIILMDLQMPEVDGYKATRYIRQVMKNNIPILAMTADALKGEAEKCFEVGMSGFISKPFDPLDLYDQILKFTKNTERNRNLPDNPYEMEEPLIDFEFLKDISGGDPNYVYEVLEIFLTTTPDGIQQLGQMINDRNDWDAVSKQAHSLKSSVSVIKIRGVYDQLAEIEKLTRKNGDEQLSENDEKRVNELMNEIAVTFSEAHPLLIQEKENNNPAKA